jgi:ElaB/YqjD/DUF883 family membrane-anchored ribosome-binding protein
MQDMQEPNPSVQSHFPTDDTAAPTDCDPLSGPLGSGDGDEGADRPAIVAVGVAAAQAAGDTLHQQVTAQMGHAAQGIESAATVAEQMKVTLRQGDHETLAHYAEETAVQLERLATHLRAMQPEDIVAEADKFMKRNPALALGAAFALGLLSARLLRGGKHETHQS